MLALLVCALSLLSVGDAEACSGAPGLLHFHPSSNYWRSDAVFTGSVTEIVDASVEYGAGENKRTYTVSTARFEVEEGFRGVQGRTVEVASGQTSMCVYEYRQGERYFVYAGRSSDGKLRASIFSRTRPLADASDDLAYAHDMARGEKGARLFGLVQRLERKSARDYAQLTPQAGASISIDGLHGQHWKTITDARGQFEVRRALPGPYRIRARLAENIRVAEFEQRVYIRTDDGSNPFAGVVFTATSLGAIGGRLIDGDGQPVSRLMIDLLPVGEAQESTHAPVATVVSDEKGEYLFEHVAPGRYRVAVNSHNHRGRSLPAYKRSYYPGVSDAAQATLLTVKENLSLRNDDFRVPPPRKERTFAGVVLMQDGAPVAGAQVSLVEVEVKSPPFPSSVQTDEVGRFVIKGYKDFQYCIEAVSNPNRSGSQSEIIFAPAVKIPAKGEMREIRLVLSSAIRASPCYNAAP